MHIKFPALTALAAALFAIVAPTSAHAHDPSGLDETSGSTFGVGGGVVIKPRYEGSNDHETIGFPIIIPDFSGGQSSQLGKFGKRFSFKGIDDIRFRLLEAGPFEVGPVAGYRSGRDEDDGDRLGGLGDIDGGLVLGGYAGLRFGSLVFDASAVTQASGDDTGVQIRFGAETVQPVLPWLELTARIGTALASENYMETYFGVSAAQAISSTANLQEYDPDAGFKDVFIDLSLSADLGDHWVLKAGGRYSRLIGDAADSPVIETEDQFSGMLGIAYKFPISR